MLHSRRGIAKYVSEILEDIKLIKPRCDRFNKRLEYIPYEYDKGIYLIDVKGVKGVVEGYGENVLTSWWWALFLGLLTDSDAGDCVDTGGGTLTLRSSSDVNYGTAYIPYGTGVAPESFLNYNLASRSGGITTSITLGYLSDRLRITLSGTLPADASEVGIDQLLFDTYGFPRGFLLARKTGSFTGGQQISYYIDFLPPWSRATAEMMWGILRNSDVNSVRLDGATIPIRSSGDVNASGAWLVASPDLVQWSPDAYAISNAFSLSTHLATHLGNRYTRYVAWSGISSPQNNIAVNTVGLYQSLFDAGGISHTFCMLINPLSSPITFYAGRNNLVVLRIIAV